MDTEQSTTEIILSPVDNRRLSGLRGQCDENIRLLETELGVEIHARGNLFQITGHPDAVTRGSQILRDIYQETQESDELTTEHVHLYLNEGNHTPAKITSHSYQLTVRNKHGIIKARSHHQQAYLDGIKNYDLTFGIGPAGTGKTFLAVACAVEALEANLIQRILLVRPAVEAGESLGFLPGDLSQKIDPYCRPLYDALYDILGFERVAKLIERQVIEVAPLAYMRGRTLTDAFIILDEGQNTTAEQMKMFLTRMGFNCTVVVTGDVTQIDLPKGQRSGLVHCLQVLKDIDSIHFVHFHSSDVVRHSLVQRIIEAYEQAEKKR